MRFHKKNSRSLLASLLIHALWATFAHHKDVPTKSGQWVGRYNKNIGPPHDLPPLRSFVLSSIFRPSPHQSDQRIYDAPRRPVAVAPLSSNSRKAILRKFTDCSSPMIFVIRRFHLSERERRIGRDLTQFWLIQFYFSIADEENGGKWRKEAIIHFSDCATKTRTSGNRFQSRTLQRRGFVSGVPPNNRTASTHLIRSVLLGVEFSEHEPQPALPSPIFFVR